MQKYDYLNDSFLFTNSYSTKAGKSNLNQGGPPSTFLGLHPSGRGITWVPPQDLHVLHPLVPTRTPVVLLSLCQAFGSQRPPERHPLPNPKALQSSSSHHVSIRCKTNYSAVSTPLGSLGSLCCWLKLGLLNLALQSFLPGDRNRALFQNPSMSALLLPSSRSSVLSVKRIFS